MPDSENRPYSGFPTWDPGNLLQQDEQIAVYQHTFAQDYLPNSPLKNLVVIVGKAHHGETLRLVVTDQMSAVLGWLEEHIPDHSNIDQIASHLAVPVFDFGGAWKLTPVFITKPWGREIWYTGIEERGQSALGNSDCSVPLPWVLSVAREHILGRLCPAPVLLKILDPLPDKVYGELYFELHEHKREVYVVTAIDQTAWPDGSGMIRYGFRQKAIEAFSDEEAFREAFTRAVVEYRQVRNEIDLLLEELRGITGLNSQQQVTADGLKKLMDQIPEDLLNKECEAREVMNDFIHHVPLNVGDVVKIAPLRPHSLQHGVRTVEFQTPVYERKIISFPQKVLTQTHWDTEEAIAQMNLEPGAVEALGIDFQQDDLTLECVVDFDDFVVHRLTIDSQGHWELPKNGFHHVIIAITGLISVGEVILCPEEAAIVPASANACCITNNGAATSVCLVCGPKPLETC